jgi:hypothetical protein
LASVTTRVVVVGAVVTWGPLPSSAVCLLRAE